LKFDEPVVAEGHAEDVRGEILESGAASAYRLTVNDPALFPDAGVQLREEAGIFEFVTQLSAEDQGEWLLGDQKVRACRAPTAGSGEAAAGDHRVNANIIRLTMWMEPGGCCLEDRSLLFLVGEF